MEKTTINVRINKQDKDNAKMIFDSLGLDMSTAINMFIRQTIIENGLPFRPTLDAPQRLQAASYSELLEKLAEGERSLKEGNTAPADEFLKKMSDKYDFKL
ncbi:type II toxin-antitoxin system RelB/DinJ family antitoxin [Ruminococcus sp. Marseille-P6503]|uniref:type II toxin-antitoxin system RelB/DinJ family antitoxin n=1 Tax=Ruminococcus sp. Marseille-P6503 TaxID=2364796 RepID=UPI000F5221EB|nr:type II toxin-antitoxin system RelB/DinJ family antitoxin [Ruminococcus sp. Marseille-P6503]